MMSEVICILRAKQFNTVIMPTPFTLTTKVPKLISLIIVNYRIMYLYKAHTSIKHRHLRGFHRLNTCTTGTCIRLQKKLSEFAAQTSQHHGRSNNSVHEF